ncbi:MAG TPA: enolase C-terminal domain-like protein [Terriglobales bacterium]|nr:enolase C-terminal domain-like protein [Terriglobales bacterium]
MRINSVTVQRLSIPFRSPFIHASKARGRTETVVLWITGSDGITGVGEILPRPYLTGETIDSVSQSVRLIAQRWVGETFRSLNETIRALHAEFSETERALATFAGWELAVLDLAGKSFNIAAGDVLGDAVKPDLQPGVVIDFALPTKALEKHCILLRLRGQRHIKVKVGRDDDLVRLQIVSQVFGKEFPLRLDANGIWTADEAIRALRRMRGINIASIEQPVPAGDLTGMRRVRQETRIPVVADESVCSYRDAERVIDARAADVFNVRLAKCGGFLGSLRLSKLAAASGFRCQLGTLVGETGILSAAAETFGRRLDCFDFLEGKGQSKRLLVEDVLEPSPSDDGAIRGLGIRVAANKITRWAASAATTYTAGRS